MSEIDLVIKIPENTYRQIQALARNGYFEHDICGNSMRRIANGIPLPKGHGRLIDADYKVSSDGRTIDSVCRYILPTIIEADKE